ncbi:AraC-type DNA-binding protein [Paenibacillus sophorae]|uniref:AraC family transcriptional regulator n=1 Tax=Paenibacillus sophorae TaxID=1333845 RepID=A0A1H8W099_9BACL|nr:AraC family transcriptional regulator [Paenibacillus sophorae]QWU15464.1 AraC family transcriptional regulator [Paenibacillus sophorae]SEP21056.1 AraC-type DNA-binding protein [Paenibacillus sophorae]
MSKQKFHTLFGENISTHQKVLDQIITMTERITNVEGSTQTIIPFLSIIRKSHQTPLNPSVLTPSFCLILQGTKKLHLGQDMIHYHSGDYLASVIDMPASAQVIGATKETPYIGLHVDITTKEIASVVMEAEINVKPKDKKLNPGVFIGRSDSDLLNLFIRLLKLIDKPKEARFLSPLIKREMIFNLLSGDYGHLFFQQVFFDQQADGIGKAISWIRENYARSFSVQELAKSSNMSVSGLHHKFKAVTTMGLLQYQKLLRLQEARRLMLSGSMDATTAALEVGYESPSQFSREYRRLFGLPPHKDIKAVKKSTAEGYVEHDAKTIGVHTKT